MLLMAIVGGAIDRASSVRISADASASSQPVSSAPAPDGSSAPTAPTPAPDPRAEEPPAMQRALSLADAGRFSAALEVALSVSEELRHAAISSVFSRWADEHPKAAAAAAITLSDDAQRNVAWHAVATRWSENDPASLAAHAWSLDDESLRGRALDSALPRWLERDEPAALAWVGALPSSRASDPAVALVAGRPSLIEHDPELAVCWAETIADANLRSRTLAAITRAWLLADPEAATRYARRSPDIFPAHREDILVGERFTAHP